MKQVLLILLLFLGHFPQTTLSFLGSRRPLQRSRHPKVCNDLPDALAAGQEQCPNDDGILHANQYHDDKENSRPLETKAFAVSKESSSTSALPSPAPRARPFQRIPILEYHADWVCVNKPAGMSVHGTGQGRGTTKPPVLTSTLKRQLSRKVYPVHRLDHRTSGVLLLAAKQNLAAPLHDSLSNAQKVYVALLRGNWDSILLGLTACEKKNKSEYVSINSSTGCIVVEKPLDVQGTLKEAKTLFQKLAVATIDIVSSSGDGGSDDEEEAKLKSSIQECTLVLIRPQTGRTHQIRRHAFHLGMPILGDTQHGNSRVNRWWRTHRKLDRLALHCLAVEDFEVPVPRRSSASGGNFTLFSDDEEQCETICTLVAPLSADFKAVLEHESELWKQAVALEPRLAAEFVDVRGGTLGIEKAWQSRQRSE